MSHEWMKTKLWVLGLLQKMCFNGCCFDFLFFFFSATLDICLASHAINWDSLKVLFLLHSSATFVVNQYCLGFTSELCKHVWQKKKEWLKLNSFWHPHAAVISLPENRHCDNSIRNWGSSIMDGQPCKWILFSGLWTKTELTESRLS